MEALNSVIIIFTIIGVGFFLSRKGVLDEKSSNVISRVLINVSIPVMLIASLPERFTKDELFTSIWWLLIAYVSVGLTFFTGKLIGKITKCDTEGIFLPMITFSNTLFIGLPVNIAIFGEEALPYIFLFYLATTTSFWTLGVSILSGKNEAAGFMETLKKLITPPIKGFFVGVFLIITGIELFNPIQDAFKYIGSLTTPLSLLFIGTVLSTLDLSGVRMGKKELIMISGKFIISPLITFTLLLIADNFIEISLMLKHVFLIQASMPAMTNVAIVAKYYDRGYQYASLMVGVSTLLCIVTIPFYSYILRFI